MTVVAGITVSNGNLIVLGKSVLTNVHEHVHVTSATEDGFFTGAFIGVKSDRVGSRHVFPLGKLREWGALAEKYHLRQFLIIEANEGSQIRGNDDKVYTVFLPILEGDFRAVLQGNADDELEICLESGDPVVDEFDGSHLVFVGAGSDPFDVITSAVKTVEGHLQTFCHHERKKMPDMLNWFGWCTWDAFYTDVTAEGEKQGLESLEKGGYLPKFVIIDDDWQSVGMDPSGIEAKADNCAKLTDIKENHKFQKDGKEGQRLEDPALGLRHIVSEIKDHHATKYVYVWHTITGYWGGVKPGTTEMDHYDSKLSFPKSSLGVQSIESCDAFDCIARNGLGLVNTEKVFSFYNELHSYLALAGIDGVKVDVQNILETLGEAHGGRVQLARKYHQALEASVSRNFPDNGIISCMSRNTDGLYSAKSSAVIRESDDFWPRDPPSHTIHIASVAYNSVFLGEFMQPDWDMFHSLHPMVEYHGAARAVGGCAIYVSDKPRQHDFDLLKKLVLPDGSILRAKLPGRPTRDCLFSDPARDGKSLLKIWTGVIGVFNCQGAGWCKTGKRNLIHDEQPGTITGVIRAKDVHYLPKLADYTYTGDAVLYSHQSGTLWTAVAHIITGVLGSGVLSLGWSLAQLGWIAGPLAMLIFASITLVSTYLLCNCYRSPDPEHGPTRNRSYLEAAQVNLGETSTWLCGIFLQISFYGFGIAYTITSAISMRAIQKTNCHHSYGHDASCEFKDTIYILIFGASQVFMSQIPDFHNIEWLSIVAAIMSFAYSIIAAGLALAKVIGNGVVKGSTFGIYTSAVKKTWLVSQAIGDVAFAFPFAIILIEIQDTLKSPPAENETMKKASTVAITITTFFYLCCGAFGYAAFGDLTPGNLLTGFNGPFWLVDFANVCIVLHMIGGYQVYSQPVFAMADKWFTQKYPNSSFVTKEYTIKLPKLPPFNLNLFRLCFRTAYVASTTVISMLFPYFNQVLGVLGAINFWSLSIYFPVEMYFVQRNIGAWTTKWIMLRMFSLFCLVVTIFALVGSLEGLITAKIG